MQIFHKTNFDFVSKRKIFLTLSVIIISGGILLTAFLGLDYGIDFEGGIELAVKFEQPINTERIRSAVSEIGIQGSEIKSFGAENQYIIRVKKSSESTADIVNATKVIADAINNATPESEMTLLKVDEIGAKIGAELRNQAILAMIIAFVLMLIYIAFRFEFVYGLGAVFALLHDIVVTFTVALVLHKSGLVTLEINQTFLAAMLTVIGYSINNTVIIFDRIRENVGLMKGKEFINIANISINETLSRTVITVTTVLLVLITLIIFGGPVLLPFALIMTLGTVFGVYSSIYISSSFVIWFQDRKAKKPSLKKA
ncbi:MAG: protein translocase subunit SecF [Bacteroidetes bacterium]|nr:protein translocase subunit SecF [Bacteroidota bacterium]